MKKFLLIILFLLVLADSAQGQEILSVDNARSYVLDLDDGGKKYPIEDFLKSDKLSFLEGHKLQAYIIINRVTTSNPPDTYVLEMRTDLRNAEWQYKIFGETKVIKGVKVIVWNNPRDHSAFSFDIVLSGEVPKPAIKTVEPYFESYTGEGPGFRHTKLAIFTIYNGEVNPNNIVQDVGEYAFFSTNSDIKKYLEEIKKNLDTSGLGKDYVNALEEQKKYILKLGEKDGHVGLSLDLSRSFAGMVANIKSISPKDNTMLLVAVIIGAILLAVVIGIAGYKMGQGEKSISPELLNQFDTSCNTLKQNLDKLERIDISGIPRDQAAEIATIKRQAATSIASLKNILNQLR